MKYTKELIILDWAKASLCKQLALSHNIKLERNIKPMNIKEIVREYLIDNGYAGLQNFSCKCNVEKNVEDVEEIFYSFMEKCGEIDRGIDCLPWKEKKGERPFIKDIVQKYLIDNGYNGLEQTKDRSYRNCNCNCSCNGDDFMKSCSVFLDPGCTAVK